MEKETKKVKTVGEGVIDLIMLKKQKFMIE